MRQRVRSLPRSRPLNASMSVHHRRWGIMSPFCTIGRDTNGMQGSERSDCVQPSPRRSIGLGATFESMAARWKPGIISDDDGGTLCARKELLS